MNGTVPTAQRFFIDQKEFTIQQTPHGPENTSTGWPWTNFINQGKWGANNSHMWTYPNWELYLTIFEGFWDGKNDNPNPAPVSKAFCANASTHIPGRLNCDQSGVKR